MFCLSKPLKRLRGAIFATGFYRPAFSMSRKTKPRRACFGGGQGWYCRRGAARRTRLRMINRPAS
jgi:hypothetical protein